MASMNASDLLTYITSAKLGEGTSWKGDTTSFVFHWVDQHRLYEGQIAVKDQFSPAQKRAMLENAIQPIPELRAVKVQADQHKVQTGWNLSYDQYLSLVESAAANYDSQFDRTKRPLAVHPAVMSTPTR